MRLGRLLIASMTAVAMLQATAALAAAQYKIVTASEKGTYIVIGRDLATYVAPGADIDLEALPSAGSAENIKRLRYEAGVKFALVQSDVYQAFLDQAAAGNSGAGHDHPSVARDHAALQRRDLFRRSRRFADELRARDQGCADQCGADRERHGADHRNAVPVDVQRTAGGAEDDFHDE